MVELKLIIADHDLGYINAMTKYLSSWGKRKFHMVSFTNPVLLKEYLTTNQGDILLISPDWIEDDMALSSVQVTVLLNDSDRLPGALSNYPSINKYQPGDVLGKQLIRIFSEHSDDEMIVTHTPSSTSLIGIYSPAGGVGKTTLAVTMARLLAKCQIPTLLLSLEDLASYGAMLQDDLSYHFSDILYFVKQKHKNLMLKVEGLKSIDEPTGLHYFSPVSCYQDMQEVTIEEWVRFITYIKEHSGYERIVLDFDSSLGHRNIKLLGLCEQLMVLANEQPVSIYKVKKMYQHFDKMGMTMLREKASLVVNDNTGCQGEEGLAMDDFPIAGHLPYDDTLNTMENQHINLEGILASSLKEYLGFTLGERDAN